MLLQSQKHGTQRAGKEWPLVARVGQLLQPIVGSSNNSTPISRCIVAHVAVQCVQCMQRGVDCVQCVQCKSLEVGKTVQRLQ